MFFFVFLWSDEFVGNRNSGGEPRRRKTTCGALAAVGMNFVILKLFFFVIDVSFRRFGQDRKSDFGFQDADAESQGKPGKKKS